MANQIKKKLEKLQLKTAFQIYQKLKTISTRKKRGLKQDRYLMMMINQIIKSVVLIQKQVGSIFGKILIQKRKNNLVKVIL